MLVRGNAHTSRLSSESLPAANARYVLGSLDVGCVACATRGVSARGGTGSILRHRQRQVTLESGGGSTMKACCLAHAPTTEELHATKDDEPVVKRRRPVVSASSLPSA